MSQSAPSTPTAPLTVPATIAALRSVLQHLPQFRKCIEVVVLNLVEAGRLDELARTYAMQHDGLAVEVVLLNQLDERLGDGAAPSQPGAKAP